MICIVTFIKRRNFAEKESQMMMFIMVAEMRGLSCDQIVEEMAVSLHIRVSHHTVYNYIRKMEEYDKTTFQELRQTGSSAYMAEVMKLLSHLKYYRSNIMRLLLDDEFKHQRTPAMIMKVHDMLFKLDQTQFNMLEAMPSMFGWKGLKSGTGVGGRSQAVYGSAGDQESEKDISQYISALEQHPIPADLLELQSSTEYERLGTHIKKEKEDEIEPEPQENK